MIVSDDNKLTQFVEKPIVEHLVNTGVLIELTLIYLMLSLVWPLSIDMPQLLEIFANKLSQDILVINIKGNYLDLGTFDLKKLKSLLES